MWRWGRASNASNLHAYGVHRSLVAGFVALCLSRLHNKRNKVNIPIGHRHWMALLDTATVLFQSIETAPDPGCTTHVGLASSIMTPTTHDDYNAKATGSQAKRDFPVCKVADAIRQQVAEAVKNQEANGVPLSSTVRDQVAALYV